MPSSDAAILFECLRLNSGGKYETACRLYSEVEKSCDVSRSLPEIVQAVNVVTSIPAYKLTDTYYQVRKSFESYRFPYTILKRGDENFPSSLPDFPFLYAFGNLSLLEKERVTVLGMKTPDEVGRMDAVAVLKEIAQCGLVTMGTIDLGLDSYCMLYALNQRMKQIVVLASPLHQAMPESQKDLMMSIANAGSTSLLLSPFAPSTSAEKWFTVPRNQLLLSLTDFLVLLEERDGGPLWKFASAVKEKGGRVMLSSSSLNNPAFTYARDFASSHEVLTYVKKNDFRKHFATSASRKRQVDGDVEQLELF